MAGIKYRRGDIFEANVQVIVNTVNCEGIMGKGLALEFKKRYPNMFPIYQQECKTGKLRIGRPTLYCGSEPWILNFPTKTSWRANSKLEYLEKGLEYFIANYKQAGITSIAFPKLGAQNGKLSWDEVGPLMVRYLCQADIDVYIYIADGDQEILFNDDGEKFVWQQFNKLALSVDRLQEDVKLSAKEARRVHDARKIREFAAYAEVEKIDKLAKISLQRIKTYIHNQRYHMPELPGMPCEKVSTQQSVKQKKHKLIRQRYSRPHDLLDVNSTELLSLF